MNLKDFFNNNSTRTKSIEEVLSNEIWIDLSYTYSSVSWLPVPGGSAVYINIVPYRYKRSIFRSGDFHCIWYLVLNKRMDIIASK